MVPDRLAKRGFAEDVFKSGINSEALGLFRPKRDEAPLYHFKAIQDIAERDRHGLFGTNILISSHAGSNRSFSFPERIPRQPESRTEKPLRIVFGYDRTRHLRIGFNQAVRIEQNRRGSPVSLAPAIAELMAEAETDI